MQSLEDFFSTIPDQKAVRVTLPGAGNTATERIQCVYGPATPPLFFLYFAEGDLPMDAATRGRSCVVTIDIGGQNVSVTADIEAVRDNQTLELQATELINHEQVRNYFRVDAVTPIALEPLIPFQPTETAVQWPLVGETIDISGSGALCTFSSPLEIGEKVRIALTLPTGLMETMQIIGHVVRCRALPDKHYQVGLHFDALSSEDRDRIMASCFHLQRKHLRLKVQVKGTEQS